MEVRKISSPFNKDWIEDKHPRDEDGKFSETAGEPRSEDAGFRDVKSLTDGLHRNPFNDREFFGQWGDAAGAITLKPKTYNGRAEVHIEMLRALTRGGGRAMLEYVTALADKNKITLDLFADPLDPGKGQGVKMSPNKLKAFYREFGFKSKPGYGGSAMVRRPQR